MLMYCMDHTVWYNLSAIICGWENNDFTTLKVEVEPTIELNNLAYVENMKKKTDYRVYRLIKTDR